MSATGKDTSAASTPGFITALVSGFIILTILLAVWFVIRKRDKKVFQPRTMQPPPSKRVAELPLSPLAFFKELVMTPDRVVLDVQGPDAYMFLRFIRLTLFILVPFFFVTWIILMPIYGTGSAGKTQVNQFSYGNIGTNQTPRYVATFLVAIILTFWTLYLIHTEYDYYRKIRQEWLASEQHSAAAASRTVVVTNIPADYLTEEKLLELGKGGDNAFGVQQVWLARQIGDLEKIYDERNKETGILENSEGKVLALAAKNKRKNKLPPTSEKATSVEAGDIIGKYILKKKRPTHRRGILGKFFLGKKFDTLNDSPTYINDLSEKLTTARSEASNLPLANSAFIRFNTREEAHAFASTVGRGKENKSLKKVQVGVEIIPEDVIWNNLKMSPWMRTIRTVISWSLTIFLVLIWSAPVAFVGSVSNISALAKTVSFLSFLEGLPPVVIGIINGLLPPVLLAVLMMMLPIVLRLWVKMEGKVRRSDVELELFTRFWLFQVIQGFLVITLSSGLTTALKNIKSEVSQLPTLLATNLPAASTFFLQWLSLYALTSFGLSISRVVPFVMSKLGSVLSGPTPRKTWKFDNKMLAIAFATTWPPVCLLACVAIVYSCIQPIICIMACFTFACLYVMYKYVLIWCADQPAALETGGEYMRKAIDCIFVSLYVELLCLCGLFFLASDTTGKRAKAGIAGGALMIVMIIIVACFQWYTCHIRHPKRACHFLDASIAKSSSRTAINAVKSDEVHTYPPSSKEGDVDVDEAHLGLNKEAFDHPALWKNAPVVWIADDELGIGRSEVERLNAQKVKASSEFATMDSQGKVHVDRCAPDEAWFGGRINI